MTEPAFDLLIRGGRVATASDVFEADVAISGETIAAIGRGLPGARREIDARGKLVLPGGVDSHAHIEQLSAAGIVNADTFESATVSAAFGGTMLCAHAENHGIISWMVKRLLARGYTDPKYHAISHARVSEAEAFNRLIGMAALIDQPIMIFHVTTAEGAKVIRDASGQGLKVFAETCPP